MSQPKYPSPSPEGCGEEGGPFPRIPSESVLNSVQQKTVKSGEHERKPWERSQSAMDLKSKERAHTVSSVDVLDTTSCGGGVAGAGSVSEHAKVYWDLSKAEDEMQGGTTTSTTTHTTSTVGGGGAGGAAGGPGKFKISLQTIHQKQEMKASNGAGTSGGANPKYSVRMVRRMSSESVHNQGGGGSGTKTVEVTEFSLPATPISPSTQEVNIPLSPSKMSPVPAASASHKTFKFSFNQTKPNLTVTLSQAVPIMQENIRRLRESSVQDQQMGLDEMLDMIKEAWATPMIGRDLAYGLCDVIRDDGGLEVLIGNCDTATHDIKLSSARVLEQSMTVKNRDEVARKGLEVVVKLAKKARDDNELIKASMGILENLFKHSEETCSKLIKFGGLDSLLYFIRTSDTKILRHCAIALANLAIYGGQDNQSEMISKKVAEWLFPLAFSSDDSIRYYAFLAIAALSANKELETAVVQSGTLALVEPFVKNHDPMEFAQSDTAHIHGQSKEWLRRLVPLLSSKREEAQSLAAFHFAMEAGIKKEQGHLEVIFHEIGAIEPLKRLASSTNKLASKFAIQALVIIGEEVPYTLSPQVPLWTVEDVKHWLTQCGFTEWASVFQEFQVDGDLLLQLTERNLSEDLSMENGITRKRFLRELDSLKMAADYHSCDPTQLDDWLREMGSEFKKYAYQMLRSGADRKILRWLTEEHLGADCGISNGIHRMKILEAAKRFPAALNSNSPMCIAYDKSLMDKPLDCFISYRRSSGSQLASLLKVHLQLRGFTVFLDIEKLKAGKFDDNLLNSVRNAKNFIIVLTPCALDRCVGDHTMKDWVHREIVAALEGGCNIIPVTDSFEWPLPESLPADMRPMCYFNGIRWIHDYQEACVDKLEKFIHGEINPQERHPLSKGGSTEQMHGAVFRMGSSTDYGSMEEAEAGSKESLKGGAAAAAAGGVLSGTLGNPGHMTDHAS